MPYRLPLDDDGTAACRIFTTVEPGESCTCDGPNRAAIDDEQRAAVLAQAKHYGYCGQEGAPACADLCVCENLEAVGDSLDRCLGPDDSGSDGWCYVDPAQGVGTLHQPCETEPQATVRFSGAAHLNPGERAYLACSDATERQREKRPLGAVCVPSNELDPTFSGFKTNEVTIDQGSASCASGTCVVQNFRGRVSCPFGNGDRACTLLGSNRQVEVLVPPQLLSRPPALGATCSCRCAGPGDGPFCACEQGQACVPLVTELGLPGDELAGSYCIPEAPAVPETAATCADVPEACGDREL